MNKKQLSWPTLFITVMRRMILDSLASFPPKVDEILAVIQGQMGRETLQSALELAGHKSIREGYLKPAVADGRIEMAIPGKSDSRLQKYQLTGKGRLWLG